MIRFLFTLSCLVFFSFFDLSDALAQQTFKTTSKSVIGYLQYLPDGYNSNSNNYPVVIFLHGKGEKGPTSTDPKKLEEGVSLLVKHGPPKHVKNGTKFPFILISPQLKSAYGGWPTSYVMEVIEHVQKTLRIDKSRICITGLSMGGFGTWAMIQQYPHMFAAAAPVCGGGNTSKAKAIADENLPVWAFHGDADNVVSVNKSISMVNAINSYNPNPRAKLSIYKGVKHNAWDNAYLPNNTIHNPNVYQWMMSFRNNSSSPAPENKAPVANAGSDKTIKTSLDSYIISGSGKDEDGTISSYSWSKVSGGSVTLSNANSKDLKISGFEEGIYVFKLTVTDNKGAKGSDEVKITVEREYKAPVAMAGEDKTIQLPENSLVLKGQGKSEDGEIIRYSWSKISGSTVELSGENTPDLTLKKLVEGEYTFRLKVESDKNLSGYDEVKVMVIKAANKAPVANAGSDQTIKVSLKSFVINGSGKDDDGTISSYVWTKVSGGSVEMENADQKDLTISKFEEGVYVFKLTVSDNKGAKHSDEVRITVEPGDKAPVAMAGEDKTIQLPQNSITLKGEGKVEDGNISSYAWTQVSGNEAKLSDETTPDLSVKGLREGEYTFRLKVKSDKGLTDTDDVKVTVLKAANKAPVANAGSDQTIKASLKSFVINGSGKDDDGTISSYAWTKVSGGSVEMENADQKDLTISKFEEGVYVFKLTVSDNKGAKHSDDVRITVEPGDKAPVAMAGEDKTIQLPQNSITLKGEGKVEDGNISSYAWTKISGGEVKLSGEATQNLTVKELREGEYTFRLKVKSDKGLTDTDDVKVFVKKSDNSRTPPPNKAPVANAGPDKSIESSLTSFVISGSGKDEDGSIGSFSWSKVSGGSVRLTNADKKDLTISEFKAGAYVFRLTVQDDKGAKHSDDVKIEVKEAVVAENPVADAGNDVTIQLPVNKVSLKGSAKVKDGKITAYEWTKKSGGHANLAGHKTANLTVTELKEGSYVFRLKATSDKGLSGHDEVKVIVEKAVIPNKRPVANAGPDKTVESSETTVILSGSGTDEDGTITSYSWKKLSGGPLTMINAKSKDLTLKDFAVGKYLFRLTVMDNQGRGNFDDVLLTVVEPKVDAPVAYAGNDRIIRLPENKVTIKGGGKAEGRKIVSYEWIKISGGQAKLSGSKSQTLTAEDLNIGEYQFRLKVTCDEGLSATDDIKITVKEALATPEDGSGNNDPIVASGGPDMIVTLPIKEVYLHGSGSSSYGRIVSYQWVQVSGSPVRLNNAYKRILQLTGITEPGIREFKLTVRDNTGRLAFDHVRVVVQSPELQVVSPEAPQEEMPDSGGESEEEMIANLDLTSGSVPNAEKFDVAVFNDRGELIFRGKWNSDSYRIIFDNPGFYVYHLLMEGRRVKAGKILIQP